MMYFCKHLKWLLTIPILWAHHEVCSHSLPTEQLGYYLHFILIKQASADIIRYSFVNNLDHFFRVSSWLWRSPSFPKKGRQGLGGDGKQQREEATGEWEGGQQKRK